MTRQTKLRLGFALWIAALLSLMFGHAAFAQPGSFYLWGDIRAENALYVLEYLRETKDPIVYINSSGGEIQASLIIAGAITQKGNVRCIVKDLAASGAFAVLQACQVRQMKAGSSLVTHEPRTSIPVPVERITMKAIVTALEEKARFWNDICRRRLRITAADYEQKVKGKDWRMDSSEALRVGAVDSVIP